MNDSQLYLFDNDPDIFNPATDGFATTKAEIILDYAPKEYMLDFSYTLSNYSSGFGTRGTVTIYNNDLNDLITFAMITKGNLILAILEVKNVYTNYSLPTRVSNLEIDSSQEFIEPPKTVIKTGDLIFDVLPGLKNAYNQQIVATSDYIINPSVDYIKSIKDILESEGISSFRVFKDDVTFENKICAIKDITEFVTEPIKIISLQVSQTGGILEIYPDFTEKPYKIGQILTLRLKQYFILSDNIIFDTRTGFNWMINLQNV